MYAKGTEIYLNLLINNKRNHDNYYIFKEFIHDVVTKLNDFEEEQYIEECNKNGDPCGIRCLIISLIYINRLFISNPEMKNIDLKDILFICIVLAFKFTEDGEYREFFCPMFNVSIEAFEDFEVDILKKLNHRLHFKISEYKDMLELIQWYSKQRG